MSVSIWRRPIRNESERLTISQKIGRTILDLLELDEKNRRKIEEAANVQARLIISCDKRLPGLEPENLATIAQNIFDEEEDQIEIETAKGKRIRGGKLVLKKVVKIESFGKTVNHKKAWEEMAMYFEDLKNSNALQQ